MKRINIGNAFISVLKEKIRFISVVNFKTLGTFQKNIFKFKI